MGNNKYVGPPRLIEEELETRLVVPKEKVIFVQSCGDLFAQKIKWIWIRLVLNRIAKYPEQTFLLQTKNPGRFYNFKIPTNCILGTTLETNRGYPALTKAPTVESRWLSFSLLNTYLEEDRGYPFYSTMVSIEPIMDFDLERFAWWLEDINPDFISIGADTGNNHLHEPPPKKIEKLIRRLTKTTEVITKKNLERLM